VLVNPAPAPEGADTGAEDEGRPSLGPVPGPIERASRARLEGRDAAGEPVSLTLEGMDARVVQHELDHLDGVLLLDRTDGESRRQAIAQIRPRLVLQS
jgi:peptide deformylase